MVRFHSFYFYLTFYKSVNFLTAG